MSKLSIILFIVLAAYFAYRFWKIKNIPNVPANEKIRILTDSNFQDQTKGGIAIVDFWAPWCAPCKMLSPVLNKVAEKTNNDKVRICKVNIEDYPRIAEKFSVRSIPTIILFKDGKEVNRIVGLKSEDYILNQINSLN